MNNEFKPIKDHKVMITVIGDDSRDSLSDLMRRHCPSAIVEEFVICGLNREENVDHLLQMTLVYSHTNTCVE